MNKYWGGAILFVGIMWNFWVSCSETKLEQTLVLAGANRAELEKVLRHYKDDDRKHRAALFLLERMADCYSYDDPRIDSMKQLKYLSSLPGREAWTDSVQKAWGHVSVRNARKVYDAQVISADYLIHHIDHTFRIWDSRPWSGHYTFDEFCHYVLPYRLADEPLEAWRENYYRKYSARVDSLYAGSDIIRKIQAVETVFHEDNFHWNEVFSSLPHLGANYLLDHRLGVCRESCDLSVYLLRSLGIPAVTDHYIASPHMSGPHFWNAVRDTTGRLVPFWLMEGKVGRWESDGRAKGKVFRREYGGGVRDVTADYFGANEARVQLTPAARGKDLDLCVFTCGNYVPVDKGRQEGEAGMFRNLEPGIRFFPMYRDSSGRLAFAGHPFCIDSLGSTVSYVPDTAAMHRAVLRRKYSYHFHLKERAVRMAGNLAVGSAHADFRTSVALFTFPRTLKTNRHWMDAESDVPVRYVRWYANPAKYNVVAAEVAFYEEGTDRPLPYRVPDLPEPVFGQGLSCMRDGDVLTTYKSMEAGDQVLTFDLGGHYRLGRMLYMPHNDGNYIEPGDEYELFYHDGTRGWQSLGRQTAVADSLVYEHVPGNAVLWLRDLTKGKEEQQFILDEDGEQVFH